MARVRLPVPASNVQLWTKVLGQIETFRALSRTQNKQSRATKTIPAFPFPPPLYSVGHVYLPFFRSFNFVLGGGGGDLRIFQRIAKRFKTSGEKQRKFIALHQCPKDFCP